MLSGGDDGMLRLWDTETWQEVDAIDTTGHILSLDAKYVSGELVAAIGGRVRRIYGALGDDVLFEGSRDMTELSRQLLLHGIMDVMCLQLPARMEVYGYGTQVQVN